MLERCAGDRAPELVPAGLQTGAQRAHQRAYRARSVRGRLQGHLQRTGDVGSGSRQGFGAELILAVREVKIERARGAPAAAVICARPVAA